MVLLTMIVLAAIIAHTVLTSVDKFRTGNITTTFVSDIPVVTSTHGDVLELARARTVETVSSQDASYLYSIYLGTTSAEIRVPVISPPGATSASWKPPCSTPACPPPSKPSKWRNGPKAAGRASTRIKSSPTWKNT
jgi:hypothetical protein